MIASRKDQYEQDLATLRAEVLILVQLTQAYWRQLATPILEQLTQHIHVKTRVVDYSSHRDEQRTLRDELRTLATEGISEAKAKESAVAELIKQNLMFRCMRNPDEEDVISIKNYELTDDPSTPEENTIHSLAVAHVDKLLRQTDFTKNQYTMSCCSCVDQLLGKSREWLSLDAEALLRYIQHFQVGLPAAIKKLVQNYVVDRAALTEFSQKANGMLTPLLEKATRLKKEADDLHAIKKSLDKISREMQTARDAISEFATSIEIELRKQLAKHHKSGSPLWSAIHSHNVGTLFVEPDEDGKPVLLISSNEIKPAHELKIPAGDKTLLDLATKYVIARQLQTTLLVVQTGEDVVKQAKAFSALYDDANRKLLKTRPDDFTKYLLKKCSRAISKIRAWLGKERTTFHRHPEGQVVTEKLNAVKGRLATNPMILHPAPRGGNKSGVDETSAASAAVDPRGVKPKV